MHSCVPKSKCVLCGRANNLIMDRILVNGIWRKICNRCYSYIVESNICPPIKCFVFSKGRINKLAKSLVGDAYKNCCRYSYHFGCDNASCKDGLTTDCRSIP